MAVEIPLTRSLAAIVDDADAEWLSQWKWLALSTPARGGKIGYYAARQIMRTPRKVTAVLMHRAILDAPRGLRVDHRNGDKLDNRRANLRLATNSQNLANRHSIKNRYGYLGIWKNKAESGGFYGYVTCEGKCHRTETYRSAVDAAKARDALASQLFGEFAALNFPVNNKETF